MTELTTRFGTPVADSTVVIATMARECRRNSLLRAIASVRAGNASSIEILIVVNGDQYSQSLVDLLGNRGDLSLARLSRASLPGALYAGRKAVRSQFFAFLDDDDEYLPGAIDKRIAILSSDPKAGLVASNGFRVSGGRETLALNALNDVESDPLAAVLKENWLASCGGLYRTERIPTVLFEDMPQYLEWTWLAFRIVSIGEAVRILPEPTFRIHDTPESESKSEAYMLSHVEVIDRMMRTTRRADILAMLGRMQSTALNCASNHYRKNGLLREAWRAHLRSLRQPGGLRYITYTRHLIFGNRQD